MTECSTIIYVCKIVIEVLAEALVVPSAFLIQSILFVIICILLERLKNLFFRASELVSYSIAPQCRWELGVYS